MIDYLKIMYLFLLIDYVPKMQQIIQDIFKGGGNVIGVTGTLRSVGELLKFGTALQSRQAGRSWQSPRQPRMASDLSPSMRPWTEPGSSSPKRARRSSSER